MEMNPKQFELIKDEMKNQIKSQMNLVPVLRAYVNFFTIILRDFVNYDIIFETLDNLTIEHFKNFIHSLFERVNLKFFIHGSMRKKEAKILSKDITKLYKSSKPARDFYKGRQYPMLPCEFFYYSCTGLLTSRCDHCY